MAVDNADLIKRLEKAQEELDKMVPMIEWDRLAREIAQLAIDSVIADLKTMVDDGK